MELHSERESFRATLAASTPDQQSVTLIVLRRRSGSAARVWLTFDGSLSTTVVLTDEQAIRLRELLATAVRAHPPSELTAIPTQSPAVPPAPPRPAVGRPGSDHGGYGVRPERRRTHRGPHPGPHQATPRAVTTGVLNTGGRA